MSQIKVYSVSIELVLVPVTFIIYVFEASSLTAAYRTRKAPNSLIIISILCIFVAGTYINIVHVTFKMKIDENNRAT